MNIRGKTISAVKWNLLATIINTLLGVLSLWALSNLLTTNSYGVVSAAIVISNFFRMLLDFGISNSIIRAQKIDRLQLSTLFYINLLTGMLLSFVTFFFSEYISDLFKANQLLTNQIKIMSLGFIILSVGLQPQALLRRDINFKSIAKISICTVVVNFIFSVGLAVIFRSAWCVAIAFIVSTLTNVLITICEAKDKMFYGNRFKISSVKEHIKYGIQLVSDSVVNQINMNTYPVLMSRLVSLTAIGGYNIAYNLSISLFEKLNPVLSHALFPALSKIGDDDVRLKRVFLKVNVFSAMINFPLLLGIFIISKPLVYQFFDDKWHFICPMLRVLCFVGIIRSLGTPIISILLVKAQMYRNVWLGLGKLFLGVPFSWFLGNKFGVLGIVYAFLFIQICNDLIFGYLFLLKPVLNVGGLNYMKSILIPLIHSSPMFIFGLIFESNFLNTNNLFLIIFTIPSCIIIYLLTIFISPVTVVREFKCLMLNNLFSRKY